MCLLKAGGLTPDLFKLSSNSIVTIEVENENLIIVIQLTDDGICLEMEKSFDLYLIFVDPIIKSKIINLL